MKNLILVLMIPVMFLAGINSYAQDDKSRRERKADKYFFAHNYREAIDCYSHTKDLSLAGQRNLAKSYYMDGQYLEAEEEYEALIFASQGSVAEDYFDYAMALKANSKYSESMKAMDNFVRLKPGDLRAQSYMANRGELFEMMAIHTNYNVENPAMNTDDEDFGTAYADNGVTFSSSRNRAKMIKRLDNHTGKPYLDLYMSEMQEEELDDPKRFDRCMDSKYHDGPATFSNGGTVMAYSKNDKKDKNDDDHVALRIYFRDWDAEKEKWSDERQFAYNSELSSAAHPFLSEDGKTMYFVSDRKGGYGGADIYKTTKDENGDWQEPENLGPMVNTEGNEMFPFFEQENEVLFFASDGHFGLGGLDIFVVGTNGDAFGRVYNVGQPINTPQDDFAMVTDNDMTGGYLSSNRSRISDDLYAFDVSNSLAIGNKIVGTAFDQDGNPLPGTFVTLLDDEGTLLQAMTTKEDGAFAFLVESDEYYRVVGTKENYTDGSTNVNTFGDEYIVRADITLRTKPEEVVTEAEIEVDFGNLVYFNPIYFDFDKYNIRPDAAVELDKIVKMMNENPNMNLYLTSHADSRGTNQYNIVLSENRARASIEYIRARITNPERVTGEGFGETQLVNGCVDNSVKIVYCDENDHQKNRRTEFVAVKR
jgi:outer membrane protein OmpA-like peptidoglycan-associated protein/tetratricopeptide (TPR) repeat protein